MFWPFQKEQNKSIGIAAKPTPPKGVIIAMKQIIKLLLNILKN